MGKIRIKVDPKTGQNYIPRDVRRDGFVGELDGFTNAVTLTFVKPEASLADVERSLRILLQDIALRKQGESAINTKNEQGLRKPPVKTSGKLRSPQHPIFMKYTRAWLSAKTGYSKAYLSRVATGKLALSGSFIDRACFRLQQPKEELFFLASPTEKESRKTP